MSSHDSHVGTVASVVSQNNREGTGPVRAAAPVLIGRFLPSFQWTQGVRSGWPSVAVGALFPGVSQTEPGLKPHLLYFPLSAFCTLLLCTFGRSASAAAQLSLPATLLAPVGSTTHPLAATMAHRVVTEPHPGNPSSAANSPITTFITSLASLHPTCPTTSDTLPTASTARS